MDNLASFTKDDEFALASLQGNQGIGDAPADDSKVKTLVEDQDEDRPSEWHFSSPVYAAELAKLKSERAELRALERSANDRRDKCLEAAKQSEVEILDMAAREDSGRIAEFASLRERLAEVKESAAELLEGVDQEVFQLSEDAKVSRERRYEAERQLREEAKKVEKARQQLLELEDVLRQQLIDKDKLLNERRQAARKEIAEIHKQGEVSAVQIEQRLYEDVQAAQQDLVEAKLQVNRGVQDEVSRRKNVRESAEDEIRNVDQTIRESLDSTQRHVHDFREVRLQKVKEVQSRDFALEELMLQKAHRAVAQLDSAKAAKCRAEAHHREAVRRREGTAAAFGDVFPRSAQFSMSGPSSPLASSARHVISATCE